MEYISTSSSNVSSDDLSLWQIIPCYSDDLGADSLSSYQNIIEQFGFKGGAGDSLLVPKSEASEQSLLWGLGEQNKQTSSTLAKAGTALAASLEQYRIPKAILDLGAVLTLEASIVIQTLIKQIDNKHYQFDKYKSKKADPVSLKSLAFISSDESATEKAITYGKAQSTGVSFAKNLGNEPGNVCTPEFLASEALQLSETGVIDVEVVSEPELEKMGMGAFVSVSKGSSLEGKLIVIKYNGGDDGAAPHVLVGKGITFDTGGISLKPGAQMDEMKYDMCGAASVLGTMKAIAELKPALNIIGVVAAAENMPAGNASKPGDIVTTLSGQTVEILNTDAEGRLVLCDALTYVERFKPASVIDIATLTGACIIALGHSTSAVMSNNEELVEQILKAGTEANDKAWQLPIWDEYQTQIDSPFADMQNIGGKGAGSITAACFLSRFTKEYAWAHLDIAGTAWVSGGKDKGATGRPVPLLLQYLLNQTS